MTPISPPICENCARNFDWENWSCQAFEVIPMEIITSEFDHHKPHPKDGGIQFKAKPAKS